MTRESIKSKIAALLAKAEGTDNEFEAASFMAKVNELLEKHQIEMHEVRQAQGDQDPMGRQKGETNIYASMLWARQVAGSLAQYYGCRYIYWKNKNHFSYEIVGRESARMTFELMLPFVISQVRQQAKRINVGRYNATTKSVMEREVGQALWVRISRLVRSAEQHRIVLTGKGLIPVSDLDAAVSDFFPNVKKSKGKAKVTFGRDAQAAADKVSLHHQASGRGPTKLLAEG
jgi:hypothetical protein